MPIKDSQIGENVKIIEPVNLYGCTIGDNCFIGDSSIILPNVNIGANTIIGAGSIVTRSIPESVVAAGSPAKVICGIDTYLERIRQEAESKNIYDRDYLMFNINEERKLEMLRDLKDELNLTILLISHDLRKVASFCKNVAVMYLGRIVETIPGDQLLEDSRHPYSEALINSIPVTNPIVRVM